MLVPLIRTLQANFPSATITWVISRPAYDLVEGMEGVEFIVINKPNAIRDYWRFKKELKARSFDVLLAAQASFRANLLYPLIRASRKIGYDTYRAKDGHKWFINESISAVNGHTLDGFLQFATALGVKQHAVHWDLPITDADYNWARQHLPTDGPILLVNPAASKFERSWTVDRYIAVIKEAQSRWQAQVVLTGGPGLLDRELANEIMKDVHCIDLVGKTKPKQLLAVISQADVLLCPDTGPSHMAAAVGTPVIALHAVTNSKISGPYTFRHLVVDCYPEAVKTILKKNHAEDVWGAKVHGTDAMKLIQVEAVLAKLESVMSNQSPTSHN
ncbi:glycosyltransferase family 9 protein [Legionella hackeliae]|uniref:Heptosyl transferase, glycosyltransferase family 9 protein n=2 Tax=Legionella hackeliae TaxID=449 RepID=A0A0A8UW30_LEGHA|nr:glycosyltransferase family 9 protein [Legionella hackeliae]KTD09972.1 heptosyl transferase, glycosyltransferase family 9 protein [Legionella hackeliae]CEK11726.1 Heptosyl transferase, glycosyltransferase family 9 protein [Legionella hackeliae]STX48496.1 heptosyl transferase, glycosyltransferase family 9 protein [Legionella hackeliae]